MTANTPDEARDMVRRLIGPVGPELSCDECFDLLDVYVELGKGADAAMPAMRAHLLGCSACRDDHDSLRALFDLGNPGSHGPTPHFSAADPARLAGRVGSRAVRRRELHRAARDGARAMG